MEIVTDALYEKTLAGLVAEAHRDWLDIESTATWIFGDLDHSPPYPELRPVAIRLARDLIDAGAVAGDVVRDSDGKWSFRPWAVTPAQAIERITRSLQEHDAYPDSGELGWLHFPD
jgi:hypothetical protein